MQLKNTLSSLGSALSTLGLSLLPVFKSCPPCPFCMPKYAALLSFFGLPLADYSAYLTPLMWLSMAITFASMSWQGAKHYRHRKPSWVVLGSCLLIALGKSLELSLIVYAGMALLLVALVWHQKLLRHHHHGDACESHEASCCSKHSS